VYTAVLAFMLFHLAQPSAGLEEVHRTLRSGGTIAVGTWTAADCPANGVWPQIVDSYGARPDDVPARLDLMDTPKKVEGLLRRAGAETVDTTVEREPDVMGVDDLTPANLVFPRGRCGRRNGQPWAGSCHRRSGTLEEWDLQHFAGPDQAHRPTPSEKRPMWEVNEMFRKNEGPLDRGIRLVGGAALIALGLAVWNGLDGSVFGIVVAAFGAWFMLTGAIGSCPLYVLLGTDTLPRREAATRFGTPFEVPATPRSRDRVSNREEGSS
jgi:hypothetical protein